MTPARFDDLGESGRARRLRPLVVAALRAWDFDVERVRLVTNGYNAIFRVDASGGPFALRVNLPRRTDAELRAELDWLDALARADAVRVPVSVPTAAGEPWTVAVAPGVPEPRRCVVFRWVPGRNLRADDDAAAFVRFGAAAAALHEHASRWRRPRGLRRIRSPFPYPEEPPVLFDQPMTPRARATYERALAATERALARIADERVIVVHQDLHPANVRVRGDRLWVLDFDDCALATPPQDLGTSWFQMRMLGCRTAQLRGFRRGYEAVRAWPDDDLVAAFTAGAALTLANGVYQDFDPDYRREAGAYAARWARIAEAAMQGR